jgi:hypothetical protein
MRCHGFLIDVTLCEGSTVLYMSSCSNVGPFLSLVEVIAAFSAASLVCPSPSLSTSLQRRRRRVRAVVFRRVKQRIPRSRNKNNIPTDSNSDVCPGWACRQCFDLRPTTAGQGEKQRRVRWELILLVALASAPLPTIADSP